MDCGTLESVPPGTAHLDTVRALHQTVVSLRTALEVSKNELKELKEKYQQHSDCIAYTDVIEKLSIENHILRRKIIDSGYEEKDSPANIKLQLTYSPRDRPNSGSGIVIKSETESCSTKSFGDRNYLKNASERNANNVINSAKSTGDSLSEQTNSTSNKADSVDTVNKEDSASIQEGNKFCTTATLNLIEELPEFSQSSSSVRLSPENEQPELEPSQVGESFSDITKDFSHQFKTKLELLSKFDVKIKVRTLKEGDKESTSSDSDSIVIKPEEETNKGTKDTSFNLDFEEKREHIKNFEDSDNNKIHVRAVSTDNIKMAVPSELDNKTKSDKFDVQVRITSEESLVVKETTERTKRKDTLNLDVDDLSLRSMSEGDNSVFSEGTMTPMEPAAPEDREQENPSDNESEEVDDIELIFTTDESKDMSNYHEDLVSIRDTEQWHSTSASSHSTPVLIKFHTLDPDFQPGSEGKDNVENENQENSSLQGIMPESLRAKRVSLPSDKEIRQTLKSKDSLDLPGRGILKTNKSDNMLYKRSPNTSTRKIDSVDSLTCEYNRGLSFDNTKSLSFELDSSMDILHRDESVDSFHRSPMGGHRFSVFAETDISKCGISEDDLTSNLNARRNTCPNPFQYRPIYRNARPTGPLKVTSSYRTRPVLRESSTARRESGAQTDVSALPDRWTSDGYLAYKTSAPPLAIPPTLSQRTCPPVVTSRRLTVPDARPGGPVRRSDETRRVLLSDIGFTSMVPELSRSADPLWTLKQAEASPTPNSACKFFSRNSSYRSPCVSIDRSNDWTPQAVYFPNSKVQHRAWRSSLPDVRGEDTDQLMEECDVFLRRSTDNLRSISLDLEGSLSQLGQPYIPAEPKHLRLGHTVKIITPQGRIAVGRVRYVGIAGGTAATSSFVVGAEFAHNQYPGLPRNDGTFQGRRYFLTPPQYTALFVPFSKVVMAWAN